MDYKSLLLSPTGRVNRKAYWWTAITLAVFNVVGSGLCAIGILQNILALTIIGGLMSLLVIWPNIMIAIKRNHDHDRSGWFLLLMLVPLANFWLVVEMYFVRGTGAPNRFGPDPLGATGLAYAT